MTPVYLTSTYVQDAPGVNKGYSYSRTGNPTRSALEASIAALEEGKFGLAFSSGCAATNTVLNLLKTGDHVLSCHDIYGGTYRLFIKVYERYGLQFSFVNVTNLAEIEKAIKPNTKLLWLETPSNLLLLITDIEEDVKIAHKYNILVVVDNTFASPYLQQPLLLGADIVVHSTTKYLGGHSDLVGGSIVTNDTSTYKQLKFFQNTVGAISGPLDCFLVLRGIKTLPVRMERHCANARKIATFLKEQKEIAHVNYPGLPDHPGYDVAKKQMRDFGGMISFKLKGDVELAKKFTTYTKITTLADSLESVESLINHTVTMTHGIIPPEERERSGLRNTLLRLSVGIEDIEDLIEDLEQAMKTLKAETKNLELVKGN